MQTADSPPPSGKPKSGTVSHVLSVTLSAVVLWRGRVLSVVPLASDTSPWRWHAPLACQVGLPSLGYWSILLPALRLRLRSLMALSLRASARVRARFSSCACLPVHQGGS